MASKTLFVSCFRKHESTCGEDQISKKKSSKHAEGFVVRRKSLL